MHEVKKNKFLTLVLCLLFIALPLMLFLVKQKQETKGNAQASTSLYFSPATSSKSLLSKTVGENFSMDLMINPGINLISLAKIEIIYDPTKLKLSTVSPLIINENSFPEIIEGPVYSNGKVQFVVSVGSNLTKVINQTTLVGTLNFVTLSPTRKTEIIFGSNNKIFSVSSNNANDENVLSNATPAYIKITKTNEKGRK